MSYKLFHSHTFKQLMGAAGGMAIAALVYTGFQSFSSYQLNKAMIIDADAPVSDRAGEVSVNEKTVDPQVLARLQARASQVAALQQSAKESDSVASSAPVITSLEQRVQDRARIRQEMLSRLNATVHVQPEEAKATTQEVQTPAVVKQVPAEAVVPVKQTESEVHAGADLFPQHVPTSTRLSNSGMGTSAIAIVAALLGICWTTSCGASFRRTILG